MDVCPHDNGYRRSSVVQVKHSGRTVKTIRCPVCRAELKDSSEKKQQPKCDQ